MHPHGQWVWTESPAQADSYGEFYAPFSWTAGKVLLTVSCDSNYAAYINGQLAAFGQYADFEHYKVADTVDVTAFCRPGENHLAVVVWYYGAAYSTYCPGKAGLLFDLTCGETLLAASSAGTLCRKSRAYRNGEQKIITGQLGCSFDYDAAKEDGWMLGDGAGFSGALPVDKSLELVPRPNQKLILEDRAASVPFRTLPGRYLFDLGREEVGFLELDLDSDRDQPILIAYGEHLTDDGEVPRRIGGRDFSVTYRARAGENRYLNPFRRLGCRYLELQCEAPVRIRYAGIRPTSYPLKRTGYLPKGTLDRRIYEICARTLELCLHEHYEDCPWREQSFYAMDSRNQMLAGYIAFGELEAPRAGLALFAQDRTENGLLSICCPNQSGWLQIPSFSLHYFTAVDEYVQHSGDKGLAREVYEKLCSVLAAFSRRAERGLIPMFPGKEQWNFYEWRPLLDGYRKEAAEEGCDLILNALYVLALEHMANISEAIGKNGQPYRLLARETRRAIRETFYRPEQRRFSTFPRLDHWSELTNSLAILSGAASPEEAAEIARQMTVSPQDFIPASLSMKCFFYDALLAVDREVYGPFVLEQIRRRYADMLDHGATTVWEDDEGAAAFDNAGSLCHGWSAIPIYYFHLLNQ